MDPSRDNPIKDLRELGKAWQSSREAPKADESIKSTLGDGDQTAGFEATQDSIATTGVTAGEPEACAMHSVDGPVQGPFVGFATQSDVGHGKTEQAGVHGHVDEPARLSKRNAELEAQNAFYKRKTEAYGVLQERATKVLRDEAALESERAAFKNQLDALETLKNRAAALSELQSQLLARQHQLSQRERTTVSAEGQIISAQREARAATARADDLAKASRRQALLLEERKRESDRLRGQVSQLQRERVGFVEKNDSDRKAYAALRATTDDLCSSMKAAKTKCTRLSRLLASQPQFVVKDETLLRWLLDGSSPKSLGMRNRYLGCTGSGPYPDEVLDSVLGDLRFELSQLPHESIGHVLVGRAGWSEELLLEQIAVRQGKTLRIYSAEMLVAALATGKDPLDSDDEELLRTFASGHEALEFLSDLDFEWPAVNVQHSRTIEPLDALDLGVVESPMHLMGYAVGASSTLSTADRRAILLRTFEVTELPFVESAEYMRKWGRPHGSQRLWRMATHIAHLINGPVGKDYRKPQARRDWSADLKWLFAELYVHRKFHFRWPETRVGR